MTELNLTGVKAIIQEPYYQIPTWINQDIKIKKYVILNKESTKEDVILFLIEMLGYNNIDINQDVHKVFNDIISEEEIAIAGGILFIGKDKMVFPSCCCGIETWREVLECLIDNSSPWLGHDPSPEFEYDGNIVRVWSDGLKDSKNVYFVEYEKDDLIKKIKAIESDLIEFAEGPLYEYISQYGKELAEMFILKYFKWLSIENKFE